MTHNATGTVRGENLTYIRDEELSELVKRYSSSIIQKMHCYAREHPPDLSRSALV
jgi:hypothetical protein